MKDSQGNLSKTSLPKILDLIYRRKDPAAVLDIVREPVKKRFFFKDGMPVAATSNILNEVLGRLLMQEGVITQRDYENSLEIVLKEKKKHGQVLISMGLLKPEELDGFLKLQLKRRLWKLFGWNEGTYRYSKSDALPAGTAQLNLEPAGLILDGINLGFYPSARLKTDLKPYLDTALALVKDNGIYSLGHFKLNLQEERFLQGFDGARTLREVLEGSDLLRHRALSIVSTLIITGLLISGERPQEDLLHEDAPVQAEAMETGGDTRLNAELLFMKAKSELQKKDFSSALSILNEITELNPAEGEYWAYLGWAVYNSDPQRAKEAEKIIKDSIDLDNDLDAAWYFLGQVFLATGDEDGALRALGISMAKNPWMLEALSELKRLQIKRRSKPEPPPYLEYFSFLEDPFSDVPESASICLSEGQSKAVDFLVRAVRKRSGPVLLEGGAGAGKTTVALEALKRLSKEKVLCAYILEPEDKELLLIKAINKEVGVRSESSSIKEQLLSFGMRVSQNKIQGGHTIVVIDQAERLTPGCLKLIQYLSRLKTLQIILIAGPGLSEMLSGPDFNELAQKLTLKSELGPFGMKDVELYIKARLSNAKRRPGSQGPSFDPAVAKSVLDAGSTLPSEINKTAAALLMEAMRHGKKMVESGLAEAFFNGGGRAPVEAVKEAEISYSGEVPQDLFIKEVVPVTGPAEVTEEKAPEHEAPSAEVRFEAAPIEAHEAPEVKPPEPEPVQAATPKKTKAPADAKKAKRSPLVIIVLLIMVLLAGLIVGSVISSFWGGPSEDHNEPQTGEGQKSFVKPSGTKGALEMKNSAPGAEGARQIEGTVQGSFDTPAGAPPDAVRGDAENPSVPQTSPAEPGKAN